MEAPRGAREPTGTNGPTPHQPPQPRHPPPKRSQHRHKEEDRQPRTRRTGPTRRGTGNQTPPTPRRAHKHGPRHGNKGGMEEPQPLYEPRSTHPPPNPPHGGPGHPATQRANKRGGRTTQACGGHSTGETPSNIPNLEAKPGRANGTAPQGVRESRKPPQHTTRGAAHTRARPPHTHPHTHTPTRHQRGPNTDHANTRRREEYRTPTREHTRRCAQQPPTTASYCARPPSGLRLFMFQ